MCRELRFILTTDVTFCLKWTVASRADRPNNTFILADSRWKWKTHQISSGEEKKWWSPLTQRRLSQSGFDIKRGIMATAVLHQARFTTINPYSNFWYPSSPTETDVIWHSRVHVSRIQCRRHTNHLQALAHHMTFHASASHLRALDLICVSRTSPMPHTVPSPSSSVYLGHPVPPPLKRHIHFFSLQLIKVD